MLFDTHVHFDGVIAAGGILDAIVARAVQAGVSHMIAVGGSSSANQTAVAIDRAYPDIIRAAVGYDRHVGVFDAKWPLVLRRGDQTAVACPLDELRGLLALPEVVAIGEIGLDFHHERHVGASGAKWPLVLRCGETALAQIELFQRMLLLARDYQLPVIVHTRAAETETLDALRAHAAAWRGTPDRIGVMHCFTGGEVFARDLLALGFMISFSGIITFKNVESLRAVAVLVPEDRLLIETDSPYLAPEPFRGQPNEPAHVRRVAETLATIRHTSWETIAGISARNAERLFGRSE